MDTKDTFTYEGDPSLRERITQALQRVVDPEMALSILDIGLVYHVTEGDGRLHVLMSMTSAACPATDLEIGTTFASSVVTFPTVTAHILGQLLKYLGEDRIIFGSDSPWYGNPQWQIDAMWRFQIPRWMQRQYGYPPLTKRAKRKILGLNAARIYGLEAVARPVSRFGTYKPVPGNYEALMGPRSGT